MVFQLVYTSSATQEFWPDDLFALVEKSRAKNAACGLTGMLLFHQGQFLQLLEGPEPAVRECFSTIRRDPRHNAITVLMTGTCEERDFPEWTMGFDQPNEAWHLPAEWATVLENGFDADAARPNGSVTKDMLLSFRHSHCGS